MAIKDKDILFEILLQRPVDRIWLRFENFNTGIITKSEAQKVIVRKDDFKPSHFGQTTKDGTGVGIVVDENDFRREGMF